MTTGTVASAASRRPHSSSTQTTPRRDRCGVNRRRLGGEVRRSIVPWKSRWSWERLVKRGDVVDDRRRPGAARARGWRPPSCRCRRPRSRITASSACRSGDSGVVRTLLTRSSADPGLDRADQAGHVAEGAQRGVEQVGRRRLAVGAGDPDHRAAARRASRRPSAATAPRTARGCGTTTAGTATPARAISAAPVGVGQHGRPRPGRGRRRRTRRRATRAPGQGGVQVTGPDRPRVQGDPGDAGRSDPEARWRSASHPAHAATSREAGRARGSGSQGRAQPRGTVTGPSVLSLMRGRRGGAGRRDLQLLQRVGHDVVEHRAGDRRHRSSS